MTETGAERRHVGEEVLGPLRVVRALVHEEELALPGVPITESPRAARRHLAVELPVHVERRHPQLGGNLPRRQVRSGLRAHAYTNAAKDP